MLDESLKNSPNVLVGLKQTSRALEKSKVKVVYLAQDADDRLLNQLLKHARLKKSKSKKYQVWRNWARLVG